MINTNTTGFTTADGAQNLSRVILVEDITSEKVTSSSNVALIGGLIGGIMGACVVGLLLSLAQGRKVNQPKLLG